MAETPPFLQQRLAFPFPAREAHAGVPLSNGTFGALIWGEGRHVRITINRADYWDHRGGHEFGEDATYANLKQWLAEGNEARLREVFEGAGRSHEGIPPRPTRLPMGRVDLELPEDWSLISGGLHLLTGEAELELEGHRESAKLRASILRDSPVLCLRVTGIEGGSIQVRPRAADSHPEVATRYREHGRPPSQTFDLGPFGGWTQECPGEPAMCAGWLRHENQGGLLLYVTSEYGEEPQEARKRALQTLEAANSEGFTPATLRAFSWWRRWWEQAAAVELPDPDLELLYYLGIYKLAGLSVPGGPAATLQGPWVEDHRMPPWGSDYHFNINVQECYWPAFGGNHVEALEPLIRMLEGWADQLSIRAERFVGIADGFQLPHATDDRGTPMSGFWTGFVDHGSTGWVAHLLWQYYRYTADEAFLRNTAYPFMKGVLRVYEAMLEDDGRAYRLPVGVSPEFGGRGVRAWGVNASFQLAVIHFLCRALIQASGTLGADEADRPRWMDIDRRLPAGAIGEGPELLLWDGQALTESHRHHSHLAGIYPFDTLDPQSDAHRALIRNSTQRLARMGMGQWAGWSMPWAAILHARQGSGEMAALLLHCFRRVFLGPGYFSTHDARFAGFTAMDGRPDVMQAEAGEGACAAVLEMLLHTSGGVLKVFPALPASWSRARFRGVRAEGAFLVSASCEDGRVSSVEVRSEAGLPLRLQNPWGDGAVKVSSGDATIHVRGRVLDLEAPAGATLLLEPRSP